MPWILLNRIIKTATLGIDFEFYMNEVNNRAIPFQMTLKIGKSTPMVMVLLIH
jgi:hypothetical protein